MSLNVEVLKVKHVFHDYGSYRAVKVRVVDTVNNTRQVLWLAFDDVPTLEQVETELREELARRTETALTEHRFRSLVGKTFTVET